ncbi:hypothetical protein D3C71_1705500 [compost metagenome]
MQNKIFHEAANVYDAGNVNIADIRQLLLYTSAGFKWTVAYLNAADTCSLAKTGIDADYVRVIVGFVNLAECFF